MSRVSSANGAYCAEPLPTYIHSKQQVGWYWKFANGYTDVEFIRTHIRTWGIPKWVYLHGENPRNMTLHKIFQRSVALRWTTRASQWDVIPGNPRAEPCIAWVLRHGTCGDLWGPKRGPQVPFKRLKGVAQTNRKTLWKLEFMDDSSGLMMIDDGYG